MTNNQFLLSLASFIALLLPACGPVSFVVNVTPQRQELESKIVERAPGFRSARIAIVDVSGMIHNSARSGLLFENENPVSLLQEQFNAAAGDGRVRAVILRINSPGGTVTASDVMHRIVKRFERDTGKPVVALLMDVAASGGYYVACAADEIVAYPTTLTGSVGVIMQTLSVKPALGRIGVRTEAIVSGPNKAIASPLGTMTQEHRAILQSLVDDYYAKFVQVVRDGRPNLDASRLDELIDGRIMSGEAAAMAGMVDHVGDLETARRRAAELAGIENAELIMYHRPHRYVGSPYAAAEGGKPTTQINLAQFNLHGDALPGFADSTVGIYYLWQPTLP